MPKDPSKKAAEAGRVASRERFAEAVREALEDINIVMLVGEEMGLKLSVAQAQSIAGNARK